MKLNKLRQRVYEANMELPRLGLVIMTWGNVSEIDRKSGLVAIKPSGVEYGALKPDDIAVVDLDGKVVEGLFKPSSDTQTHLALYKAFPEIGGITHTHSTWATAASQAGFSIPAFGTTHADYFYGEIPLTREMSDDEINTEYELNTGLVIIETMRKSEHLACGVLVKSHGPFAWGKDAASSVENAAVMEEISKIAAITRMFNPDTEAIRQSLLNRHFLRKHGESAYYGQ